MQLQRGLAVLGDGDAGEAAGLVRRLRRSTAAEPQKNEAFQLSRPRWMTP